VTEYQEGVPSTANTQLTTAEELEYQSTGNTTRIFALQVFCVGFFLGNVNILKSPKDCWSSHVVSYSVIV